jgi:hypothetical protein
MFTDGDTNVSIGRREFLQSVGGGLVVLTLVPVGCGSGGDQNQQACNGLKTESEVTLRHQHSLCIPTLDLSSPPAAGHTYSTSSVESSGGAYGGGAHFHDVTLSAADLSTIAGGGTVTLNSGEAEGHFHGFIIHM